MNFLKSLKPIQTPKSLVDEGYVLCKKIGEGSYSETYHCNNKKTQDSYACKISTYESSVGISEMEEYYILSTFIHPNLPLLHTTILPTQNTNSLIHMMNLGLNNLEYSVRHKHVNTNHIIPVLSQVASALSFLHTNHCLHLDIKPENILVILINPNEIQIQLIDFSISMCHIEDIEQGELSYFARVSSNFRPLEGFFHFNDEKKKYGYYTDVWGYGILGLYLISKTTNIHLAIFTQHTWIEETLKQDINKTVYDETENHSIFNETYYTQVPFAEECKKVIQSCFHIEPSKRPTMQEIYHKPFLYLGEKGKKRDRPDNGMMALSTMKQAIHYIKPSKVLYCIPYSIMRNVHVNTLCIALELYHYCIPLLDTTILPLDIVITCFLIAAKLSFRKCTTPEGVLSDITEKFKASKNTYVKEYINQVKNITTNRIHPIELKITSLVKGIFFTNHHYDLLKDQMDVCIYFSICFSSDIKESYYDFNQELLEKYRRLYTRKWFEYKNKSKLLCKVSTLPYLI